MISNNGEGIIVSDKFTKGVFLRGYKKNDFPIAEYQAKHLITLPIHQFISKKQIYYMFECIKKFYQ